MLMIKKPDHTYLLLALILIISKMIFKDFYPTDQLIIYNFLSLLMMAVLANLVVSNKKFFPYFLPLIIPIYFFLPPGLLKYFFIGSHVFITALIIWLLLKDKLKNETAQRINFAAVPLELLIIISF